VSPPRPAVDLLCPNCGLMNYVWDLPKPYEHSYCVECGADLQPDPPARPVIAFAGAADLDAGAQQIREHVEALKRRR
jgi:hypothetical protein